MLYGLEANSLHEEMHDISLYIYTHKRLISTNIQKQMHVYMCIPV